MTDWLIALIPAEITALSFWFLIVCSFFTSALTAAVGIGGGVTLLAIMANLVPPTALIPVHAVIQLGSNVGRLLTLLGFADWRMILWFSLGSIVGSLGGGQVAVSIPPASIQVALGAFILYSTWLPIVKLSSSRRSIFFLGGGTGFLSMMVGGVAPFIYVVIRDMFEERRGVVATIAAMNSIQQILRAGIWGLLGFTFAGWWGFILLMIATGFLGTLTGKQFLDRVSTETIKPILNVILSILALRLLYVGVTALMA